MKKRTILDKNKIKILKKYSKMFLYDEKCNEIGFHIFDTEDIDKVKDIKWYLGKNGYVNSGNGKNQKRLIFHRFILDIKDNYKNLVVDHVNRNPLDNRKENLRLCGHRENIYNSSIGKNNTSGFIGVTVDRRYKNKIKYLAQIVLNNKRIFLGRFNNIHDAVKSRLLGEMKYFGKDFSPQKHLFNKYGVE